MPRHSTAVQASWSMQPGNSMNHGAPARVEPQAVIAIWQCSMPSSAISIRLRDFRARLSVFGNLVTKHGYRPYWGLGRRALIKDASLGVLLGPRLRRPVD